LGDGGSAILSKFFVFLAEIAVLLLIGEKKFGLGVGRGKNGKVSGGV